MTDEEMKLIKDTCVEIIKDSVDNGLNKDGKFNHYFLELTKKYGFDFCEYIKILISLTYLDLENKKILSDDQVRLIMISNFDEARQMILDQKKREEL